MSDETKIHYPHIAIEEELKKSYLDYAMSVIIGRALPDVRDGLKPVHRRILYGMWEAGNTAGKAYKKSARIVGDVMGKYHPHGDSAIYDTIVRMAQDFSMRHCLVDGQGNFGSVDGDPPAAMRYTEVRLEKVAHELLGDDIDKETVDWVDNYDGSLSEPQVLPARFPNLLVNGSTGIAVGMATNIPPHNLGEVIDATIAKIENPGISIEELMEIIPGPDFPTGATILGRTGSRLAFTTGRGSVLMRSKTHFEDLPKRRAIIVDELPFQVNKARLLQQIARLVNEKRLEGIADLRDESDRDGIRMVIELKRDAVDEVVLNNLFKITQLQTSFGVTMLAIADDQPKVMALPEMLQYFIEHRKEVVVRRTRFELRKAQARAHILEGLVRALDHLDEVIALIRSSGTPPEAKSGLVESFEFSEIQAQAILEMRLQRLTGLERDKILAEYEQVLSQILHLETVLATPAMILAIIVEELQAVRDDFANPRRSEFVASFADFEDEDLIPEEEMVVTVTSGGYIKRSALDTYREQRRGGRGRKGMETKTEQDVVEHLFIASTHATMLFFTAFGQVYSKRVFQLPEAGPAALGRAVVRLLQLDPGDKLQALLAVEDFKEHGDRVLFFATRKGRVKRTTLADYANIRTNGIRAISINEGDDLLTVRLTGGDDEIFLGTRLGQAIRFSETDVRVMGRSAAGVKGIELRKDDELVEAAVLPRDDSGDILVVTDLGYGKRTPVEEFRLQGRGGYGVRSIRLTARNGEVAAVRHVHPGDGVVLITEGGILIRMSVDGIRKIGRTTQGVRLIRIYEDDKVTAVARIVDQSDEDEVELVAPLNEDGDHGDPESGLEESKDIEPEAEHEGDQDEGIDDDES